MSDPIVGVRIMSVAQLSGIVAGTVTGVTGEIRVSIPGGGRYWYEVWLSDSATDPTETVTPPTSGDSVRWEGVTDANGLAVIKFKNTVASHSWYAWAKLQKVTISTAIAVGV